MDNRLTDLSHPAVAAQSRNKTAIAGTCTMNTVLAAAYIAEVLKGVRSLPSYLIFLLLCLLPCVTSILAYTKQKDTSSVRYLCGGGFALLYAYVMFTSSTDLTFCYVIVMLLFLAISPATFKVSLRRSSDWLRSESAFLMLASLICAIFVTDINTKI